MHAAKRHHEHAERQGKVKSEQDLHDLTRCAACYNYAPRRIGKEESSSSEDSGPEVDSECSSCSSSETDFEELWTQDTTTHCTVAPDPRVLEGGKSEGDNIETSERRAVSVPSGSVLPQSPKVVSVLNLQVIPPRYAYGSHYIIRRCPSDMGPSMPDERRETYQMEPTVAVQQPPVLPVHYHVHWPQQLTFPPLFRSAPAPHGQALPFVPHYSGSQVYGPYAPVHGLGSSQSYQPSGPQ